MSKTKIILSIVVIGVLSLIGISLVNQSQDTQIIQEIIPITEISITNYKIDSACEIVEFYEDFWNVDRETLDKIGKELEKESKSLSIKAISKTWNSQYGELFGKLDESYFNLDNARPGGFYIDNDFDSKLVEVGLITLDSQRKFYELVKLKHDSLFIDFFMEKHSIDPILRNYVLMNQIQSQYLLEPTQYTEDISCGKRYFEKYSDKVTTILQQKYGEEIASHKIEEIKQVLYD